MFEDGEKNGEGTAQYPNGNKFSGTWENNVPKKGELLLISGDRLNGEWKDDRFSGAGIIHYRNGNIYEGEWKKNMPINFGVMKYRDGGMYNG